MTYLSDEDFERLTRKLRITLGIDDQLRPDMIDVITSLKRLGYIADWVHVPDQCMAGAEAKFDPKDRKLYLSETTYLAALGDEPRARWTIAHEVGHIALAHHNARNRNAVRSEIERIAPTVRRDEAQANRFAAAFLAPFHKTNFSLEMTATQLADRFGISVTAATNRVEELARIYRQRNGIQRPLPQGIIDFLKEAQRKGHKIMSLASEKPNGASSTQRIETEQYEGDACPRCGNFTMIRNGTCFRCTICGIVMQF